MRSFKLAGPIKWRRLKFNTSDGFRLLSIRLSHTERHLSPGRTICDIYARTFYAFSSTTYHISPPNLYLTRLVSFDSACDSEHIHIKFIANMPSFEHQQ